MRKIQKILKIGKVQTLRLFVIGYLQMLNVEQGTLWYNANHAYKRYS